MRIVVPPTADSLGITRLYRYEKFCEERIQKLLIDRTVRFANPISFNDPWDCRPCFAVSDDLKHRTADIQAMFTSHKKHFPQLAQVRDAEAAKMQSDFGYYCSKIEEFSYAMWNQIGVQYRVYCLATRPDCQLMWAHYGDRHKGICFEFDAQSWPFAAAIQVQYFRQYPQMSLAGEENVLLPLISKSDAWRYENEFRLISDEHASEGSRDPIKTKDGLANIPKGVVTSVILGCSVPSECISKIRAIVRKSHQEIPIRMARSVNNEYALEICELHGE